MFRFHKSLDVITLFHRPTLASSVRVLNLLKQGSTNASEAATKDQTAQKVRPEFELHVTEDPPTSDQLRSILEYVGAKRVGEIVRGARNESDAMKKLKEDSENLQRPLTVDWSNGRAGMDSPTQDMEMPRALFSTNLGQHPPRPLQPPLPSIIVRSNPELDKHVFGMALRQRWPPTCKLVNQSFNISDYFDDMDIHVQGGEFLWHVLYHLSCENTVRREGVAMFAMDWSRANGARFEALRQDTDVVGFFSAEEAGGFGEEWLSDVFFRLKEMRLEGRGTGALTRNTYGHSQTTAGARPRPQPYANTQVKSPPQIQRISCTSPVYTPSMISSGSWSGQQTPVGPGRDGYQWMNGHGSPPPPSYNSPVNQLSPTVRVWDPRGQLPPPRFPADLSHNAFGDDLYGHGSFAARRSRAPPPLRLNSILHQDQTPLTAVSFAERMPFQSASPMYPMYPMHPMHDARFQYHNTLQTRSASDNAGPVNPQPVPPQPTKPNPVVNTRDPSYIPGDARLLQPGYVFHGLHPSNPTHGKSAVMREPVGNEQKVQKQNEFRPSQLDTSSEGNSGKPLQGQNMYRASPPKWNTHNNQADPEPQLNSAATSEHGNNGRAPLIDSTNRASCANVGQLTESSNTTYNNNRVASYRGMENHLSVFVSRYAPSTTVKELSDIFGQFGLITDVFMKQEPYYAYVNFRETDARNRALANMNGFMLNGRPLLVEPKRQIRTPLDRNLRKFSGNGNGTPLGYQAGAATHEVSPHAHKVPGGAAGLFPQVHRDGKQMASQHPLFPVPTPQQPEGWNPDSFGGYEGPSNPMGPSPQTRHPWGHAVVNMSMRGHKSHNRDSDKPHPVAYHGPPSNSDADYPPLNALAVPGHNGIGGAPPSKSPKKSKRVKGYKKLPGRRNTRIEADKPCSPVQNAPAEKLETGATSPTRSGNASDSSVSKPRSSGAKRRFSF
ncbi:MAG: hypothetical protein M1839_006877 [Geoglossum umbratile]|nr:MAG: hypothetical protein M1839_006877 [Geoglossum umbratile]